jgi:hypothetical protein
LKTLLNIVSSDRGREEERESVGKYEKLKHKAMPMIAKHEFCALSLCLSLPEPIFIMSRINVLAGFLVK